jgi:hypothetical protein
MRGSPTILFRLAGVGQLLFDRLGGSAAARTGRRIVGSPRRSSSSCTPSSRPGGAVGVLSEQQHILQLVLTLQVGSFLLTAGVRLLGVDEALLPVDFGLRVLVGCAGGAGCSRGVLS